MKESFISHSAEETQKIARMLAHQMTPGLTLCLFGDLGAGKTTFAQGILEAFGAARPYTSPTFVIMKEYELSKPFRNIRRIYHVDAYRVEEKDLAHLGFPEWYADPQGLVLLECPERVKNILPEKRWEISFATINGTERKVEIKKGSPR